MTTVFGLTAAEQAALNGDGGRRAVVVSAATITPEDMTWLWPGRLAVGALTNTVGLPDHGKTLLFCDLAGRLSTGSPIPRSSGDPGSSRPLT